MVLKFSLQVLKKCHLTEIVSIYLITLMMFTGTITEYDEVDQLLQKNISSFSKLVLEFLRRSSHK
ncbi:hypothetical protein AHAS_Ahas06G0068200 [Arachis hypogaea]